MAARTVMWFAWMIMAFVTGCYSGLSLATFANIYNAQIQTKENLQQVLCVGAASFSGSVLVLTYNLVSFFIMLGKTVNKSGAGFSYGFISSSASHMSILSLLCGLVLHGSQDSIREALKDAPASEYWQEIHDEVFLATIILAYVSSFVYVIFFFVLLGTKSGVRRTEVTAAEKPSFKSQKPKLQDKEVQIVIDTTGDRQEDGLRSGYFDDECSRSI